MKPGLRLLFAAVVLVSLPGGCATPFPRSQASTETQAGEEKPKFAEFSRKNYAKEKAASSESPKADETPQAKLSSAETSGFDDATRKLIETELKDATPEERAELMSDLKGVPPDLVERILSVRRMTLKHQSQPPTSNTTASIPKPSANGSPDGNTAIRQVSQEFGHSGGGQTDPVPAGAPSIGTRTPWNHTARRPDDSIYSLPSEPGTPSDTSSGLPIGRGATGLAESNLPANVPPNPALSPKNPVQLQGFITEDGATSPRPELNTARSLVPPANQMLPSGGPSIPSTLPANPPFEPLNRGQQTVNRLPGGESPLTPGLYQVQGTHEANQIPGTTFPAPHSAANEVLQTQFQSTTGTGTPLIKPAYGQGAEPDSVYPGNVAGARHDALVRMISLLESEVAVASPGQTELEQKLYLERHVQLRMLYLMSGQQERALQSIPGIDPADLEFWQYVFWSLSSYFDDRAMPQSEDRAAQTVAQLTTAIMKLKERANLELRNVAFCHTIASFGNYERYTRDEFSPGQPVMLYAELSNFHSELTSDDRFRTLLRSTLEIRKLGPNGELVEKIEFRPTEDLCRNHRHDYFHAYEFEIPRKIAFGPHVITLTVEDQLAQKVATYSLNFTVK